MLLGMIRANPIRALGMGIALAGLIMLGLLSWRVNYLSDKVSDQKAALLGYRATISQLQSDVKLRDQVSMADHEATIANEIERFEIIGALNEYKEYGCTDVVHSAIDGMHNSISSRNN